MERILITGGPKTGKSTLAKDVSQKTGAKHYCTDPRSMCDEGVTGIPDYLDWSGGSLFVSENWLGKRQLIEGVAIPRALRKYHRNNPGLPPPCDKLIVLETEHEPLTKGQESMKKGLLKVLKEVLDEWPELARITEIH